ncbi:Uncharacterised protein [uncultured Blautia sp.]|nr:hypothetical protein [uncultured Blautia sp.]SCH69932.1 Uncharacterised protein [uncultured Blautia sp.]
MAGRPATTLNPDLCTICGLNIDYVMQRLNFDEKNEYMQRSTKMTDKQIKRAQNGQRVTTDSLKSLAAFFSAFIYDNERKQITEDDLQRDHVEFKKAFPPSIFKNTGSSKPFPEKFIANRLFRGYYLLDQAPYAYQAYFMLWKMPGNKYKAAMIRGILDFNNCDIVSLRSCLEAGNFDALQIMFEDFKKDHKHSNLHLHLADNDHIRTDPDCLEISFVTQEDTPKHCTLVWDIGVINRASLIAYDGGICQCIDSGRNKFVCAYKLGLEAIDMDNGREKTDEKPPLNKRSPLLIEELSMEVQKGISKLDTDARWYYFIKDDTNRIKPAISSVLENTEPKEITSDMIRNQIQLLQTLLEKMEK